MKKSKSKIRDISANKPEKKRKMQNIYEEEIDDDTRERQIALIKLAKESLNFDEVLSLTYSKNALIRLKALQRLCPCRVGDAYEQFWSRIFQMVEDPCPKIRYQVLHNMCDGSPPSMEEKVKDALEVFNRDEDGEVRRKAHKVIASYMRTGKWNIL